MKSKIISKPLFSLQRKGGMKIFVIFSVIVAVMMAFTVGIFPLVKSVADGFTGELGEKLGAMTLQEYFNSEAVEMWVFLVGIFVAVMAVNITTTEFKNGSYELIYTLNIGRNEIVRTKLLRLVLNTIYLNLVAFVVSIASLLIVGIHQFSVVNLLIFTLMAMLITLQIAVIVFSLGLFHKKYFNTFSGILLVIFMYLFTTLASFGEKLTWLKYLSPISSSTGTIMTDGFAGIFSKGISFAIWTGISALLLLISTKKFKNDDLC